MLNLKAVQYTQTQDSRSDSILYRGQLVLTASLVVDPRLRPPIKIVQDRLREGLWRATYAEAQQAVTEIMYLTSVQINLTTSNSGPLLTKMQDLQTLLQLKHPT